MLFPPFSTGLGSHQPSRPGSSASALGSLPERNPSSVLSRPLCASSLGYNYLSEPVWVLHETDGSLRAGTLIWETWCCLGPSLRPPPKFKEVQCFWTSLNLGPWSHHNWGEGKEKRAGEWHCGLIWTLPLPANSLSSEPPSHSPQGFRRPTYNEESRFRNVALTACGFCFSSSRVTGCHGNLSAGSACWLPSQGGSCRLSMPRWRLVLDGWGLPTLGQTGSTHSSSGRSLGICPRALAWACTTCSKAAHLRACIFFWGERQTPDLTLRLRLWGQTAWFVVLTLPWVGCVILRKTFNFLSLPGFPHL